MGVLSGDHAGVSIFVTEYVRVLLASGGLACGAALSDRDARAALDRVTSVVTMAGGGIRIALEKAFSTVSLERTSALTLLPPYASTTDQASGVAPAHSRVQRGDLPTASTSA